MEKITKDKTREIVEDFAREIESSKRRGPKPAKTVIDFRSEKNDGFERQIYHVPIELLRYRKDNGRISSDIASYEHNHGKLDETCEEHQKILRGFLERKDPEKTEELLHSMQHAGQREAAIITCDGFLINGNRRKMIMEALLGKFPGNETFKALKVVILPGKDDEGGAPTLLQIEQIENRYQLQSEAKAEYSGFDRALSMRRKILLGMSLEAQLRDDPIYAGLDDKRFKKEVKKIKGDYLLPLESVDRYLNHLEREEIYETISTGSADREGRWQAFTDYSTFYQQLKDEKKRIKLGIDDTEIGKIEDVAFKIIRKRELPGVGQLYKLIRDLPKLIKNKDSKKELFKLIDVELKLPKKERLDKDGKEYDERTIDKLWGNKHAEVITRQVKKAVQLLEYKEAKETPLTLLAGALKKLSHKDMDAKAIRITDIQKARNLAKQIQERANDLEHEFYRYQKNSKKLSKKTK